ncbi:hypothetical protein ACEPAI_7403 [Sanghuangporus weigelae]
MVRILSSFLFTTALFASAFSSFHPELAQNICVLRPDSLGGDASETIVKTLERCSQNSVIIFTEGTFHIERVMVTTGLQNVKIDMRGTFLWGTDLDYWRNNSIPLGYQNQTVAWKFGGKDLLWEGHNAGTFDGNGQLWYDLSNGTSNLAGRPINLMITNTTDSVFDGIRFVQSQFWTMAITHSKRLLLQNIYINSTSFSQASTLNTDGVDTFYSSDIVFRNWTVDCGDDFVAPKANSSNILIQDSHFYHGTGVAIGSIGQYLGEFEYIENVLAERITCTQCEYTGWIKTWTGIQQGYPPNGGGGGLGYARNITFRDWTVHNITREAAHISQCISNVGATGGCDTSKFQISDVTWENIRGSENTDILATLQCSGAAPCRGIRMLGFDAISTNGTKREVKCSNVVDPVGFKCTTKSLAFGLFRNREL